MCSPYIMEYILFSQKVFDRQTGNAWYIWSGLYVPEIGRIFLYASKKIIKMHRGNATLGDVLLWTYINI